VEIRAYRISHWPSARIDGQSDRLDQFFSLGRFKRRDVRAGRTSISRQPNKVLMKRERDFRSGDWLVHFRPYLARGGSDTLGSAAA
jgi:hypothetical protein